MGTFSSVPAGTHARCALDFLPTLKFGRRKLPDSADLRCTTLFTSAPALVARDPMFCHHPTSLRV